MQRLLICGTNWLGDSIMSMPALQALRRARPDVRVTLLVKPPILPLWEMHDAVDAAIPIYSGRDGTRLTVRALRSRSFDRAVIFPNSFRAAFLPFRARVPQRIGAAGHWRRALLTACVSGRAHGDRTHQAAEYFRLLGLEVPTVMEAPRIAPPKTARDEAASLLGEAATSPWLAVLPGAARGSAKRWPAAHFAAVARRLVDQYGVRVAVCGTASERAAADEVTAALGHAARNLAGQTSLAVLAALLDRCRLALTNDSGGMHLASAVGTPVVAIFGLTDPELTGPLGAGHRVLCGAPPDQRSRDIARESAAAEAALRRVPPEQVWAAAHEVLASA